LGIMQSHPNWMVKRWIERFGFDEAEKFAEANNKRPVLTIRVNTLKTSRDELLKILDDKKIVYRNCRYLKDFFTVRVMSRIYMDDAFKNGFFAVQDESAGLPSVLLDPREGECILDMCAAPGGKTTHISQLTGSKAVIYAVDKHEARIKLMKENAQRLGCSNIEFVIDDSKEFKSEILRDKKFDKILLDAPCSGLGVISKKPEIRWKREPEDIIRLSEYQKVLLENASRHLVDGGVIVYSTCSTEPEENQEVVKWFLERHPEYKLDNASSYIPEPLVNNEGFVETFPHRHGLDGSFAARLIKVK